MWAPEDFPGAANVPWPLLIRARWAHQIDAVAASVVMDRLSRAASVDFLRDLATVAHALQAGPKEGDPVQPEQHVTALQAFADFDDICPDWWPRRFPPRPKGFEDLFDPTSDLILDAAINLVASVGSPGLEQFRGVLEGARNRG